MHIEKLCEQLLMPDRVTLLKTKIILLTPMMSHSVPCLQTDSALMVLTRKFKQNDKHKNTNDGVVTVTPTEQKTMNINSLDSA